LLPIAVTPATIATAMIDAIRAYSIAVTPRSDLNLLQQF
jgi:hypothetical protein